MSYYVVQHNTSLLYKFDSFRLETLLLTEYATLIKTIQTNLYIFSSSLLAYDKKQSVHKALEMYWIATYRFLDFLKTGVIQ